MDPGARVVTRSLVADERRRGAAILLTSHDLTDVERLADRIVIIDEGRVVTAGTPGGLTAQVTDRIALRLDGPLDPPGTARLEAVLGTVAPAARLVAESDGSRYAVTGAVPDPALLVAIAAACSDAGRLIVELRTSGGSLEDAYLALLDGHRRRKDGEQ
jgi:ABC-2 type transport system ATP-binding protein